MQTARLFSKSGVPFTILRGGEGFEPSVRCWHKPFAARDLASQRRETKREMGSYLSLRWST